MAAEKSRKSRKGARAASNPLTPRQIQLKKESRQRKRDRLEKGENNQLAILQNQADLVNNPPVIEATPARAPHPSPHHDAYVISDARHLVHQRAQPEAEFREILRDRQARGPPQEDGHQGTGP